MGVLFLLMESASGYALFERVKSEEIGSELDEVQSAVLDWSRFSKIVKLKAFCPFTSAQSALENINAITEGEVTEFLANFLEMNVEKKKKVKEGKKDKSQHLGVIDPKLGNMISESLSIKCQSNEMILELIRGCRFHFTNLIKLLKDSDMAQAQLGLGHSYSRSKVKFNVHRVDNMIIQSIVILDTIDKDLNTFTMRVREWYSWHFPELIGIVPDNYKFCRLCKFIKQKDSINEDSLEEMEKITGDMEVAKAVLQAARSSMGAEISPIDLVNVEMFADRVISLCEYRKNLYDYLCSKMKACAPNLSALIGEQVGARLISHAGSLTNLAKAPASTVQILGAEKALFRALKTKGNTPKYGLIFHSTFIGRAAKANKGRISRYLANKCSIASRVDCFSDEPTDLIGHQLRGQVEERLEFYKTGKAPRKNVDVMKEVLAKVRAQAADAESDEEMATKTKKAKKAKRKAEAEPVVEEDEKAAKKRRKKEKKAAEAAAAAAAEEAAAAKKAKKSKKKSKKK